MEGLLRGKGSLVLLPPSRVFVAKGHVGEAWHVGQWREGGMEYTHDKKTESILYLVIVIH